MAGDLGRSSAVARSGASHFSSVPPSLMSIVYAGLRVQRVSNASVSTVSLLRRHIAPTSIIMHEFGVPQHTYSDTFDDAQFPTPWTLKPSTFPFAIAKVASEYGG